MFEAGVQLVKEPMPSLSMDAFRDLLGIGYRGCIVSRSPVEEFRKAVVGDFDFLWLSETEEGSSGPSVIETIQGKLEDGLHRKSVLLVERLDYLIMKEGFKKTLALVQRLRDMAYLSGFIIIISLDPATLERKELRLLEKEGQEIEPLHKTPISQELFDFLTFVYKQNLVGVEPSYGEIGLELGMSKPTIRKKLRLLLSDGYLIEEEKGASKKLKLTQLGISQIVK